MLFQGNLTCVVFAALVSTGLSSAARADDQPFVTIYTTDIDTQGEREIEQWLGWKADHASESSNEFISRSEFEYGVTDDLQSALYLNYDWSRAHAPSGPAETASFGGVSGELIYRVLNVYFDPIGLAFYIEPMIGAHARSFETKILAQKNFLNDTVRIALNVNFEDRWDKDSLANWNKGSALELDIGVSYNLTPDLSLGLEFDNERGYDGLILGGSASPASNAFYLGPTVQYIGPPLVITFGAQAQLPWASDPSHTPGTVINGFTADAEHFRMTLRLTRDL
jgi:hypothetical protein